MIYIGCYIKNNIIEPFYKKINYMSSLFNSIQHTLYGYVKPTEGKKYEEFIEIPVPSSISNTSKELIKNDNSGKELKDLEKKYYNLKHYNGISY